MSRPYLKPHLIHKGFIPIYSCFYIKYLLALVDMMEDHLILFRSIR